jgi:hypothetical protein
MMDDNSVDQRDERDGEKDGRAELRDLSRAICAIRGSLQELDHGFHGFHGLAAVSGQSNGGRTNAFLKLRALRALRGETRLRSRKSLISSIGLTQVVDFHDNFRYFWCLLEGLLAKTIRGALVCELFFTSFYDSLSMCK